MKLDFGSTFVRVTYSRKTFGARFESWLNENAAYILADGWEEMQPTRVLIRSSIRLETGMNYGKECGERGCDHCPIVRKPWSVVTWHGFEEVAEVHKDIVRKLGAVNPVVEAVIDERHLHQAGQVGVSSES